MRLLLRALVAIAIAGLAAFAWLFARGIIEIAFGTWDGAIPHANRTSISILAIFTLIYVGMILFTIRHVDRELRD
jgi:hypothetical protein